MRFLTLAQFKATDTFTKVREGMIMQEAEVDIQLTEIFRDVFITDDLQLKPELTAKDVLGLDSFKQIETILAWKKSTASNFTAGIWMHREMLPIWLNGACQNKRQKGLMLALRRMWHACPFF